MTTPAHAQSILLAAASPWVSASGCPEKSSAGPHEMPLDVEEIHAKFFPGEEYSNNNQSEDQLPMEEVPGMEEALSHFSSDAVYYTEYENSEHRCEATPPMIKIPYKMMLDVPLETLDLPATEIEANHVMVIEYASLFFSIRPHQYVEDHGSRMAIPGVQCIDHAMSEDTVAMEAIGYIKCMVKTELREYNYSNMKRPDEENQSLKHELAVAKYNKKKTKANTRSIKNKIMMARYKNKKNAMGWFVLTRYMHGLSDHICNVTTLNRSSRKEPMDQLMNEPLNNIEKIAERLKRRVLNSEKQLKSMRRGF